MESTQDKVKTWKDLKENDKIYIVNEGEDFGIRIEEYTVAKSIYQNDKIKEWHTLELVELPGLPMQFLKDDLDSTDFGTSFTNLEDALQKYKELAPKWLEKLNARWKNLFSVLYVTNNARNEIARMLKDIEEKENG